MEHLGSNIRKLRTEKGYTRERLAKLSGVSVSVIYNLETGKSSDLLVSKLSSIAIALGTTIDCLLRLPKPKLDLSYLEILDDPLLSINGIVLNEEERTILRNNFKHAKDTLMLMRNMKDKIK